MTACLATIRRTCRRALGVNTQAKSVQSATAAPHLRHGAPTQTRALLHCCDGLTRAAGTKNTAHEATSDGPRRPRRPRGGPGRLHSIRRRAQGHDLWCALPLLRIITCGRGLDHDVVSVESKSSRKRSGARASSRCSTGTSRVLSTVLIATTICNMGSTAHIYGSSSSKITRLATLHLIGHVRFDGSHLFFGELIPKTIGVNNAEMTRGCSARPWDFLTEW